MMSCIGLVMGGTRIAAALLDLLALTTRLGLYMYLPNHNTTAGFFNIQKSSIISTAARFHTRFALCIPWASW